MGMWPFRRKSSRRQSRGGADIPRSDGDIMHETGTGRDLGRHDDADLINAGPGRRRSRRDSQKRRMSSKDAKKLQRDPEKRRTYSFSPGRNDSIRVPQDSKQPPVPAIPLKHKSTAAREESEKSEPTSVVQKLFRANTQPAEDTAKDWQRVPTLHKRSAAELARRKSSKKRKEDHDREAEIKAMVTFMPSRPATESGAAARPMKKENKKFHGGLNRNLQNPSSDISLPLVESIHSSLTGRSEQQTSYKLSAFEMLAPRPTIRYSENPRYAPGASGFGTSERSDSRKRRTTERMSIPEETLQANTRIDDLADDLDAAQLRELMERDHKRKEKKKLADKIKMEKRLARRQEKQTEGEATAARDGTPPPVNMERGVFGRDVIGLGIGNSAVVTTSTREGIDASRSGRERRPAEASRQESTTSGNPFADFHQSGSSFSEGATTPMYDPEEVVIETAQVGTVAKAQVSPTASPRGHARGASSISQMMELPKPKESEAPVTAPGIPEPIRQSSSFSEASSRQPPQSWTSFFRRNKTKRSSTPSSFSNTSRDSMQASHVPQVGYTPMRSTSNIPKRTMSKFREDLPELPMSPPDSRLASPEADIVPLIRTDFPRTGRGSVDDPRVRYDTPSSLEAKRMRNETLTSGQISVQAPSPEPSGILSQSLASIGSEGSWLSGRPLSSKRGSVQAQPFALDSASSLRRHKEYQEEPEEAGIAEDQHFSRLSPEHLDEYKLNRNSAADASSDDEDGGSLGSPTSGTTKWGAVTRQPTVVHREPRAKSQEGLLNEFNTWLESDSGHEQLGESLLHNPKRKSGFKADLIEGEEVSLHRASSIDLGKGHARHISAGSAKLLDLKKGADGKRLSSG